MGIGLHGGSKNMIKWLLQQGAEVIATDIKNSDSLKITLDELKGFKNLTVIAGQHRPEDFEKADLVIKNPTVPWNNKYIQLALENKIPIEMDSSIFLKNCPSSKIIGITGTKGKTTTSSLIAQIIADAGKKVVKVGIGQESVIDKLEEIDSETFVVFEMSSWRLSILKQTQISPKYSVITNIYPDHLNHYGSMEEYIEDKKQIYLYQKPEDFAVINYDNEITKEMGAEVPGKVVYYSNQEISGERVVFVRNGKIFVSFEGVEKEVCEIKSFKLRGAHNLHNILGAIALTAILGIDLETIKKTLINFQGIPHRLELVRNLKGIDFYNDTTATTPESAIAGVSSFARPINLIMGGSNKELDPTDFLKKISKSQYVENIFILDTPIAQKIREQIIELGGGEKIKGVYSEFSEAIKMAYLSAKKDGIVLLSPGFASFGMFENEFDRGEQFRSVVNKLK